jgi:NSS family neurotransmitter:Na+ symporter
MAMAAPAAAAHEHWSSRFAFLMAAIGSSVGLGNFWRFPYTAGENGGAVFIFVYLICVSLVAYPVLVAEYAIGRRGGLSAVGSARAVARETGATQAWAALGWVGMAGGFLILSFYSMIAGWVLVYIWESAAGGLIGQSPEAIAETFGAITANKPLVLFAHALFMGMTLFIVARGVKKGIEAAVQILMPAFFVMLLAIVVYGAFSGAFSEAAAYLFQPDLTAIQTDAGAFSIAKLSSIFSAALGQAFFSVGVGAGLMITYGAYLNRDQAIQPSAGIVAGSDTAVAIIAGLAIFPVVFASGLAPNAGPGLFFVTLPVAFSSLPAVVGPVVATVFFVLAFFAAITSSISLLEVSVSWAEEHAGVKRVTAALALGGLCWLIGAGSVYSDAFFALTDEVTAKLMLPLGGLLVALFAGWVVRRDILRDELVHASDRAFGLWRLLIRWVAPIGTLVIFGGSLLDFVRNAPSLFGAFGGG